MLSFDAHAISLLIALAIATAALIIKVGAVSVVRVVPNAPSRPEESKSKRKTTDSKTPAGTSRAGVFLFGSRPLKPLTAVVFEGEVDGIGNVGYRRSKYGENRIRKR